MSFLKRLFGSRPDVRPGTEIALIGNGTFPLAVVGESKYQDHLEAICGGRTEEGVSRAVSASLVLEDSNPYDRDAVRVDIDGRPIGYLNRQDAKAYRQYLQKTGAARAIGVCNAQIRGGWKRGDDQGHFGVWLDLPLYG